MELSSLPLMLLLISNIRSGQTQERLKPAVIIEPAKHDTATARCELPGTEDDWTYGWFTDGSSRSFSADREFSISTDGSQRRYSVTCRGERRSDKQKSEISDAVTLTLSFTETPKAVLTVQPEPSQILRGETVTLTCDLQGEGLTYIWQCGDGRDHTSKEKELKITAEIRQKCKCYGCRGSDCSHSSDEVTLTVSDRPRVTVKPQSSVFTGDTVTLSCDVRPSTGRSIIWYKDFRRIKSGDETETLRDVRVSDGGNYSCAVERENNSTTQGHRVTLTVRERPKAVLRVQPDGRVFRGQTVTLTCDTQETDVTRWTYSWNKDDSEIHVSRSQEYSISSVSESHTGHYSCRGRETRGSRHTHTSDEVTLTLSVSSTSGPLLIAVTAGLIVLLLLIFFLVLLWRCKHNKDADAVTSDVTYADIDLKAVTQMKKNKKENKGKTGASSDTVYSELKI